jgi:hypothetical protein
MYGRLMSVRPLTFVKTRMCMTWIFILFMPMLQMTDDPYSVIPQGTSPNTQYQTIHSAFRFPALFVNLVIMQSSPSLQAVKIPSTGMNSCPGMSRSDSSVPVGNASLTGGKSGICASSVSFRSWTVAEMTHFENTKSRIAMPSGAFLIVHYR